MKFSKSYTGIFILFLIWIVTNNIITSQSVKINAVGDIMMGTDFPRNRLPKNNGDFLLKSVESILKRADITFGNLEGCLLDGGEPHKMCRDTTACYLFRTPTSFAVNLANAGFDVMSLANNHAHDFGEEGRESTMRTLAEYGIRNTGRVGVTANFRISDISVVFVGFAPSPGCNDPLDVPRSKAIVSDLSAKFDIVVVSIHGGAEGLSAVHVPDSMEIYYGEERGNLKIFSHAVIDAGADLVLGHGPHVPRAIEIYRDRLIAYSLGNFCTYKGFNIAGIREYAPILNVELSHNGELLKGKIISALQNRKRGTFLDRKSRAFKLIKKLTFEDFPKTPINFSADGSFTKK